MDAWDILKDNSTLPAGDAWDHLNNQSGEGGGGETVYLLGPATATCTDSVSAEINTLLSTTVEDGQLTANINEITSATVGGGTATCEA